MNQLCSFLIVILLFLIHIFIIFPHSSLEFKIYISSLHVSIENIHLLLELFLFQRESLNDLANWTHWESKDETGHHTDSTHKYSLTICNRNNVSVSYSSHRQDTPVERGYVTIHFFIDISMNLIICDVFREPGILNSHLLLVNRKSIPTTTAKMSAQEYKSYKFHYREIISEESPQWEGLFNFS